MELLTIMLQTPAPDSMVGVLWAGIGLALAALGTISKMAWNAKSETVTRLKDDITYLRGEIIKKDEKVSAAERDSMATLKSSTDYFKSMDEKRDKDKRELIDLINSKFP